ncbi:MAG: M23 family metallopeptidase [Alphaproteobacteria bacterium]|nr:MAG: M23 family metallopeptidase [Alphaproteobacteria bacterium]
MRAASAPVDLGDEPPLLVDGATSGLADRRRVSVQWFSGTILTGLCGAALMGGAVYIALDGEANFAALPERVEAALRGTLTGNDRLAAVTRKSDKLPPTGEINAARQLIRISTTTRAGDREVVRVRPFVRVASNLSLTTSDLSASVPKFNPARLMMDNGRGNAVAADETPGAEPDAEVSFVTRDLVSVLPRVKVAAAAPLEDVMARVRDAAEWTGSVSRPITASLGPGLPLAYAPAGPDAVDPYAGFEARIVPENITLLPKSPGKSDNPNAWNERLVTVKKNESAGSILRDQGASQDDIRALTGVLGPRGRDGGLREGQKLRLLFAPDAGRLRVVRVIVLGDSAVEAVVALSDTGKYVAVDVQSMGSTTEVAEADEDDENDTTSVRLYQSIYETAMRNNVPRPVIDDLVRIYSYDVDFQRKAQPGDSFEVLYSGEEEADARNDVLYAALTVGGESKKFYRYQSPDDGVVDYYDETGKSAKKFLVRKPVGLGIMRSGFGFRRHPILGYSKMHTGVDWSAPYGTPIFASGNGMVEKVGWEGGYGKYVRVKHSNGYETAYGHMSAFARGIEPGKKVRQGQVIGFVGSTGLSTGAHVHYEIVVNGRFVDPMRIRLPRGRVLEGPILAGFEKERDRVEGMMSRKAGPPARVAAQAAGN